MRDFFFATKISNFVIGCCVSCLSLSLSLLVLIQQCLFPRKPLLLLTYRFNYPFGSSSYSYSSSSYFKFQLLFLSTQRNFSTLHPYLLKYSFLCLNFLTLFIKCLFIIQYDAIRISILIELYRVPFSACTQVQELSFE